MKMKGGYSLFYSYPPLYRELNTYLRERPHNILFSMVKPLREDTHKKP